MRLRQYLKRCAASLADAGLIRELAIRDEINAPLRKDLADGGQCQHPKLSFSRLPQASASLLQIGVVVAGMTNEFPCAFRNAAGNRMKQSFVEHSVDDDTQRAVGRGEAFAVNRLAKFSGEAAQNTYLGVARPQARARQKLVG